MEKRKGSILIFVLFVFIIIFMTALYTFHSSTMHMQIARNNSISNQAYYTAEAKIYKVIYENIYYDNQLKGIIEEHCRGTYDKTKVLINPLDLEEGDKNNFVDVDLENRNNRICVKLTSESKVNNQTIKVSSTYSIYNELLESKLPIVHSDSINDDEKRALDTFMDKVEKHINLDNIREHIVGVSTIDCENLLVKSLERNDLEIKYFRNQTLMKTEIHKVKHLKEVTEFLLIMKDKYNKGVSLTIDDPVKLVNMRGVIYLEGDLIINSEFQFDGILIINNGKVIVNSAIKPSINGIILSNGEAGWINLEDISVTYNDFYIYRYGTYLPNVMEHKLLVTKKVK